MVIVTHDGPFNAGSVFSYAILRLARVAGGRLIRTRKPRQISRGDVVFDVGGRYDSAMALYDHHQPGGAGKRPNGVPFASAGLIWKDFGPRICQPLATDHSVDLAALVSAVDRAVIQGVDAHDVAAVEGRLRLSGTNTPLRVKNLCDLVASHNPVAMVETQPTPSEFYDAFLAAADLVQRIFLRLILNEIGNLKAAGYVAERHLDDPIIVLGMECQWREYVVENLPQVLFVVYPTSTGQWNCEAVPKVLDEFPVRLDLPKEWAGLKNEIFQGFTGVKDAIFCNNTRHVCGARSREGAIDLAVLALDAR